jgi:simple sugar transport system ATP-binding protein
MVGRKIESSQMQGRPSEAIGKDLILTIDSLSVNMPGETAKDVSLSIRRGEILGIGGLAGQGKIGIANGIMGLFPSSGTVVKDGRPVELNNARASLAHKMAFVSEDRRGTGLLLEDSIEFNIIATATQVLGAYMKGARFKFLDSKEMRGYALKMIKDLDIRCTGPEQYTRRLSGGNQQKVCVARALTLGPDLLFVSEPTRGIDVGAKKLILDLLVELNRKQGLTIVMTSSELAELRSICDRIAIVYDGRIEGILLPADSDRDFGLMMAGEYHRHKEGAA